MELNLIAFLFGAILLGVAVVGGGFELKELKVPKVSWFPRFISALLGMFFIVLGIGLDASVTPPTPFPVASPPVEQPSSEVAPPAATPSPVEQPSSEVEAVIDDPDGYTNVRLGQGIQYDIIARVDEGEVFYVIPQQNGDWWPVRTQNNEYGYMHRSRIRVSN